jgi:hypothetical protein
MVNPLHKSLLTFTIPKLKGNFHGLDHVGFLIETLMYDSNCIGVDEDYRPLTVFHLLVTADHTQSQLQVFQKLQP